MRLLAAVAPIMGAVRFCGRYRPPLTAYRKSIKATDGLSPMPASGAFRKCRRPSATSEHHYKADSRPADGRRI